MKLEAILDSLDELKDDAVKRDRDALPGTESVA